MFKMHKSEQKFSHIFAFSFGVIALSLRDNIFHSSVRQSLNAVINHPYLENQPQITGFETLLPAKRCVPFCKRAKRVGRLSFSFIFNFSSIPKENFHKFTFTLSKGSFRLALSSCSSYKRMNIQCLGLSYRTTPLALRERLAFTAHTLNTALARLGCGEDPAWNAVREMVILSTCNRVEIYALAQQPIFDRLKAFLAEVSGVTEKEFSPVCYQFRDEEAIAHLFRVAAGLDSLVLGEPQILGQVTEAYSTARRHGTVGKILSRLFQAAIQAGKRTRTETLISHNPASISSVAVSLIASAVPALETAQVMVIGAGEMAELAVEALRKRGVQHLTVVNRTLDKAQILAERWQGRASSFESLLDLLPQMDIVITSTRAPHLILSAPMVENALKSRMATNPVHPMVIMDIAVPRDVEEAVSRLPGVQLYDLDALATHLEISLARRAAEVPAVEAILAHEQALFMAYLSTLDVVPVITGLRHQADAIREAELKKAIRRMPGLSPETHEQLDLLTKSIVQKILHTPTRRLREAANTPNAADYANLTRTLFGLD